ncbi:MAG: hypothetical protein R2880_07965 [Deinococcales bacterium]
MQLSLCDWRNYLDSDNPLASALMAKMNIAKEDRVKVKLECLRLLSGFNLSQAKLRLLSGVIDTYLRLNLNEQQSFEQEFEALLPARKEKIMELTTSWEEKGIMIGEQRGEERGIGIGRHGLLLELLSYKFKELNKEDQEIIKTLNTDDIDELAKLIFELEDYQALKDYLVSKSQTQKDGLN